MQRAVKLTLKYLTAKKQRVIAALLESYRSAVNFYIQSIWHNGGSLNAETLKRLTRSRLSQRYRSQALKQALGIISATRESAKATGAIPSCPEFNGGAILDAKSVSIEEGRGSFDLVIKLSCLKSGSPIYIPTKRTAVLNKWMAQPCAKFVQGCDISEDSIVVWIKLPDLPPKEAGDVIAVDIGVCKLLSDSEGTHYGTDFRKIRDKIRRRKRSSKGMKRAQEERTNYINNTVNQLPWDRLRVIGHEELCNLKHGKKKGRSKAFRKAISPWTYRAVITRIDQKAEENRVRPLSYDPRNTSRCCPECGAVSKDNRKGECFSCLSCGHTDDADTVGARNGLARTLATLGSVESPRHIKSMK